MLPQLGISVRPLVIGETSLSLEERAKLIEGCPILRRRYKTPTDGRRFMEVVDYKRQEELFDLARGLTDETVCNWQQINPEKEIAVVLYGSVAKGLVKNTSHSRPSDIDLVVIGDFLETERGQLYRSLDTARQKTGIALIEGLSVRIFPTRKRELAGVTIQDRTKVVKNNFCDALRYIRSGATALHDPAGIWTNIERDAVNSLTNPPVQPVSYSDHHSALSLRSEPFVIY